MDEDCYYELRFVCKLCDKRFPSGKSLGGHMRSHVVASGAGDDGAGAGAGADSDESDDKFNENDKNLNSYGLRENPKKSWRASSSSTLTLPSPNAKTCKQCGKKFQSLKALCGHMAFHSEKDKGLKAYDDDSWTSENLDDEDKLIGNNGNNGNNNSDSDTDENEVQDPVFVTRSKSRRCKKVVDDVNVNVNVKVKPCSLSLTNTNSTNSNYNYGSSSVSEIDEFEQEDVAMCLMKLSKDSANWVGVNSVGESSDNASVDLETKKSSLEMYSSSGNCRNGIKKLDLSYEEKQEIRRNLFREFGYDSTLTKRIRAYDDDDGDGLHKKKNKYECLNCNKTFSSFQGLGGHRPCNKKNNGFIASEYAKAKTEKKVPKKNKWHECPICFRMFKSGQALGGHKRSHFMNGSEDRINDMAAMEQVNATATATATYTDMFDLNLPAPEED